jgi:hypothetical protein
MPTKTCKSCGETKDINDFEMDNYTGGGRTPYRRNICRRCKLLQRSKSFVKNNIDLIETDPCDGHSREAIFEDMIVAFLKFIRNDVNRIEKIRKDDFYSAVDNSEKFCKKFNIKFEDVAREANKRMTKIFGLDFDKRKTLKAGTYLIVGDSHGKHCRNKTFDLFENIVREYDIKSVIHLGHILDDDNTISYRWKDFNNVIVIPKKEELQVIVEENKKQNIGFEIIHDVISVGSLEIRNQEFFNNEYMDVSIANMPQNIVQNHTITNFHRHEMESRNTPRNESLLYMGVGCICDQFVTNVKLIKNWVGGGQMKETYTNGFSTYRRRGEMVKLWEKGVILLYVDKLGNWTPVMLRIYDINSNELGIGFLNRVVTNKKIYESDQIDLVTGDMHVPMHDPDILSIIDSVAKTYEFENHVNIGDVCHNQALNHHSMDKGRILETMNKSTLNEAAHTNYILSKSVEWAEKNYLIYANHERFIDDFFNRFPQLKDLLDIKMLYGLEQLGIELIPMKETFKIGNAIYAHGDMHPYGIGGKITEKMAKIFKGYVNPIVMGHVHFPSIRSGCYTIGLAGKLDQEYNEPTTSRWMHGFGISTTMGKVTWMATIPIMDEKLYMEDKLFKPTSPEKWTMKKYKAEVTYSF